MNIIARQPNLREFFNAPSRMMNRMYQDLNQHNDGESETVASWAPAADIYETDEGYVFKLLVPGIAKEDINVEFNDNTLSIKGERKHDAEIKEDHYYRLESARGKFFRRFILPRNVDKKKIEAVMKDGILELRIHKAEEAKPKSIAIN